VVSGSGANSGDLDEHAAATVDTAMTLEDALAWVDRFISHVVAAKAAFTELDRQAGDGDFGTNIEAAVSKARRRLTEQPPSTPGEVLQRVSAGFLATGGTSGPLLGAWFRELAKGVTTHASTEAFAVGVESGTAAVQRLGRASVGDRTMIDAMVPAANALRRAFTVGVGLDSALRYAASEARRGAESTTAMLGRKGRASYVGEAARGLPDPGAVLIADLFDTAVPHGCPATWRSSSG
jgi:dihydroxyacetone kinase-like protein